MKTPPIGLRGRRLDDRVRVRYQFSLVIMKRKSRKNPALTYVIVVVISVLCYLNSLEGDFVHDDLPAISWNQDVLGTTSVLQVFQDDFWGTPMSDVYSHKSYRPLTVLSFR